MNKSTYLTSTIFIYYMFIKYIFVISIIFIIIKFFIIIIHFIIIYLIFYKKKLIYLFIFYFCIFKIISSSSSFKLFNGNSPNGSISCFFQLFLPPSVRVRSFIGSAKLVVAASKELT